LTPRKHILFTSFGRWKTLISDDGIRELSFPRGTPRSTSFALKGKVPAGLKQLSGFLSRYFQAKPRKPARLRATLPGTPFQKRVWEQITRIPFGSTLTYRAVARRLKMPRAARAVGNACGANPLPLLIPCHRVVAESGGLGGFSASLAWKKWLLSFEAAAGNKSVSHVHQQQQDRRRIRRPARAA